MRTLIFSDSHLTERFEPKKLELLKKIIAPVDRVILNGDFWDGHETTFDKFVNSKWKEELFPLLKSKETIYIYGNHDLKELSDERRALFSNKALDNFQLSTNNFQFYIEHGHQVIPTIDLKWKWIVSNKLIVRAFQDYNGFLLKIIGLKYKFFDKFNNRKMKSWVKENLNDNEIYVCGHTHYAEKDLVNRYLNSGFIDDSFAQYLVISDNDIELHYERY